MSLWKPCSRGIASTSGHNVLFSRMRTWMCYLSSLLIRPNCMAPSCGRLGSRGQEPREETPFCQEGWHARERVSDLLGLVTTFPQVPAEKLFPSNVRVYGNVKHLTGFSSQLLHFMHTYFCISVSDHPFFVGVQYHPEFLSRPIKPSPPYFGLLLASVGRLPHYLQKGCRLSPRWGHFSSPQGVTGSYQ